MPGTAKSAQNTNEIANAIFNETSKPTTEAVNYNNPAQENIYLSIDYPSHALFAYKDSKQSQSLLADSAKPVFREWMLGGTQNSSDPKVWTKDALKGVRQRLKASSLGVFSPAFAPFEKQDSGNGDGVSVTRYLADDPIKQPIPGKNWHEAFQAIAGSIKSIARKPGTAESKITTGAGADVILPGWLGNGTVSTGAGDDIILSSPQLHILQNNDRNTWIRNLPADQVFADAYVYYPTPYALKGTAFNPQGNQYNAGEGNDLVYYDGGTDTAKGDAGNDVIAPSFGSFNWALDSLIQGRNGRGSLDKLGNFGFDKKNFSLSTEKIINNGRVSGPYTTSTLVNGNKALLSPLTILDQPQTVSKSKTSNYDYGVGGYSFNWNAYDMPDRGTDGIIRIELAPDVNAGYKKDSKSNQVSVDQASVNRLGGQKLYGGAGNDAIYGLDPSFYRGFRTAGNNKGKRLAFNSGKDKPDRQHAQVFNPVSMFGGTGTDIFCLGNPRNLEPESFGSDADYLYRISGNSDSFARKDTLSFGTNADSDVFELNLSYQGDNWTTSTVTAPGSDGSTTGPDAKELANLGFEGLKTAKDLVGAWGIKVPIFGAFAALGSFAIKIAALAKPTPREPITSTNNYYQDPIGNWRYKINIQDFDPSDAITIKIDPSNDRSDPNKRWENVKFAIKPASDTGNRQALDLSYQLNKDSASRTLIRLEDWGDSTSSGAWYGYDFAQNKYIPIKQQNLGFFGQVVTGDQSIQLPAYEDQYRFPVPAGSTVFRWTDTALNNTPDRLNQMRSNSERIVVQLDTMTLGYYWDFRYAGQANATSTTTTINNLSVDKAASKLWIRREDPITGEFKAWESYSLAQTETDAKAKEAARLATPLWSLKPPVNATQPQTKLLASTQLLASTPTRWEPSASPFHPVSQNAHLGVLTGSHGAPFGVSG